MVSRCSLPFSRQRVTSSKINTIKARPRTETLLTLVAESRCICGRRSVLSQPKIGVACKPVIYSPNWLVQKILNAAT